MLKKWQISVCIGSGMLFITFILAGIISILVMAVIEEFEIDGDFPDSQKFIHEKIPSLSNIQLTASIFFNGGVLVMIIAGILYYKDRKRKIS